MKNPSPPGFAVLYRWKPKAGMEAQFIESWSQVTALLRERGSLGSRLHRGPVGFLYGYAQWPSVAARSNAFNEPLDSPWVESMSITRLIALLLLPAALTIAAVGFFLYAAAALPYPDPTPDLLSEQARDIRTAQVLLFGGLFIFLADAVWLWKARHKAARRRWR